MSLIYRYFINTIGLSILVVTIVSCAPGVSLQKGGKLQLAQFADDTNQVSISILLQRSASDDFTLTATFTPPNGYHLYSKDIPPGGVNGQGRPTLLELPPGSRMKPAGILTANAQPEIPSYEPEGPPVYPAGPVTLTLPIKLPQGQNGWVEDSVSLTYMACNETGCMPPVVDRLVSIKVPGANSLQP